MTNERLRELCIENEWFTCGSNEEYEQLFYLNKNGTNTETLAAIIWMHSGYNSLHTETLNEIKKKFNYEELPCISIKYLKESLKEKHWGEWEIEQIINAVKEAPAHGKEYKTI